jgi:hypothetical protein
VSTVDGAGIAYGTIDLQRLAWVRTHYYEPALFEAPEDEDEREFSCRPGQVHERRPELYGALVEPQDTAFDYHYYQRDVGSWPAEFDKAHRFEVSRYGPLRDAPIWKGERHGSPTAAR